MTSHPTLSRRHLLVLPAAFLPLATVSAQSTPEEIATPHGSSSLNVSAMLQDLPSAVSDVRFSRYTLDPGAELRATETAGAALLLLRSGTVTLTSDLPVVYRRAGASGPANATDVPPDGIALAPGEGALVPDRAGMTLRATGSEPGELLMLEIVPRAVDSLSADPQEAGVSRQVLGAGPLTFHMGPAVTIVEQVVVTPGRTAYSATFEGVEMGAVERGEARMLAQAGMTWSTPALLDGGELLTPGAVAVETGSYLDVRAGDGYASYDGSLIWRATSDEPVVILRAQVIPVPVPA